MMDGFGGGRAKRVLSDAMIIFLFAALAALCFIPASMYVAANDKAAILQHKIERDELKRELKAEILSEMSEEDKSAIALAWWTGHPDLSGARNRLCWNYYPQKGKK